MPPKTTRGAKTARQTASKNREIDDMSSVGEPSVLESDIESEMDATEFMTKNKIQESQTPQLRDLIDFFDSDAKMLNVSGDPSTNIVNLLTKKCYNIPEKKIPILFKKIEACRRNKIRYMINEKQQEYSGVMLDFDIYQDEEADQITDEIFYVLCHTIIELLMKTINFGDTKKETYLIGITRRPRITFNETHQCYKDGFHLIIPGIKVTRGVKALLINKLIEGELLDRVMSDVTPADKSHDPTKKTEQYQRKHFLDKNSAFVTTFFVGASTKMGSPPYMLTHIYEATVNFETKNIMLVRNESVMKSKSVNICHEFSLNFECPGGLIKKRRYEAQEKFMTEIAELNKVSKEIDEKTRNYGKLSMNSVHDIQINEIQSLLDTLSVQRAEDYSLWRDVVFALANTSTSYKDLAEYFSRKSTKFNLPDFEKLWINATRGTARNKKFITLGSIHHWAKQDNPTRYEQLRKRSVYDILYAMAYEGYKEGLLSHSDIAELLVRLLKFKFVTDIPEGEKKRVWYEFILDDDDHVGGELYKWRRWPDYPVSLMRYMSETLPNLFEMVLKNVKKNYEESSGDIGKYYLKVLTNFKSSMRKLGDRSFKKNVILEAEDKFSKLGFAISLDKDPLVRGVANGVLKLSQNGQGPQLVQGYHTHLVSKYTDVPYIAFDPYDELTKKILITLRGMFPDNEPDTFEFTMYYLSSTIDGNPKESMFMLMVGCGSNGKTFLVELHKSAIGNIYGVKLPLSYLTAKSNSAENATPATMLLKDASLALFSESEKNEVLNAARMKEMTGQETLAGRKLHQDMVNFKPRCHYLVTSNNDFDIHSHDHGTWRRVIYNPLKIRFVDIANERIDRADPLQREADDTITDIWTADPEVRGRYLGYMAWMHFWLYHTPEFRGKVKKVPHPHIAFETEKYRRRQDTISKFLAHRLIKVADEKAEFNLVDEILKYVSWIGKTEGVLLQPRGLSDAFRNSQIGKLIKSTARGSFMIGHKFLDQGETPGEGEEYAMKNIFELEIPEDNFGIASETPEQYYEKVCKKYDQYKHLFNGDAKYDFDVSSLLALRDEDAATINIPERAPREDNVEINGRILPSGIVLRALDEPTLNYLTDEFHVEMAGFLPLDEDSDFEDTYGIAEETDELDNLPKNPLHGMDEDNTDNLLPKKSNSMFSNSYKPATRGTGRGGTAYRGASYRGK